MLKNSEITFRVVVLSVILTIVLAMSNAYLALKIGILTSASIPAAIISMGILSFFKDSSILENNLVQTAASAGEAVAGGIVYTIPALIIIHYWHGFSYLETCLIALIGGVLGVLFSIPLRRVLVNEEKLRFPEGRAIAEVLKSTAKKAVSIKYMLLGGGAGALIEMAQTGFKLIADSWQVWFVAKRALFGFGAGFSATMIGAGYLIGFDLTFSIMLGALAGWLFAVPIVSEFYPQMSHAHSVTTMVMVLWATKVRYIGIGAMLCAGIWTFITLLKPFSESLKTSFKAISQIGQVTDNSPQTDKDIPIHYVVGGVVVLSIVLLIFCWVYFPLGVLQFSNGLSLGVIAGAVLYIVVIGFVFSAITGYFSGMVGVSASPGSAIIIAGMLIAAIVLKFIVDHTHSVLTHEHIQAAEAITIIVGAVITGAACIANDNIQDLKVGQLVGATPWRQQVMLLLGVVVASLVIPPIMHLLFSVYGIAGVTPHPGMDPSLTLPAPPAALMAAITEAVFHQTLPWNMVMAGTALIAVCLVFNTMLSRWGKPISILGFAIGIYLPLASSTPLFIGGLIALFSKKLLSEQAADQATLKRQRAIMVACGLVAGSALMDVALAIPFSIMHSPSALALVGPAWHSTAVVLGFLTTLGLAYAFYKIVKA